MSDCLIPSIVLLEQLFVEIHVCFIVNRFHVVGTLCRHF